MPHNFIRALGAAILVWFVCFLGCLRVFAEARFEGAEIEDVIYSCLFGMAPAFGAFLLAL